MTKYDFAQPNQRFKLMINLSAGLLSTLAVGIFAVTKSVECAWLLGTAFLALGFLLIRPNPQYRAVTSVVEMSRTERPEFAKRVKHRVFVFVGSADLADIQAVRYGQCLHADDLTAVHFELDPARAVLLQDYWDRFEHDTKLQMVVCPARRLNLAAQELVRQAVDDHPDTRVTVLLARRTHPPLVGLFLHDRTADKLARLISRIPGATPQIVVYDVQARIAHATRAQRKSAGQASTSTPFASSGAAPFKPRRTGRRWRQTVTKLRAKLRSAKASPPPAKPVAMDYATWARTHHIHGNNGGSAG